MTHPRNKTCLALLFIMLAFNNVILAQNESSIKIISNSVVCDNDTALLFIKSSNIDGNITYFWSTNKTKNEFTGDTLLLPISFDANSEPIRIFCKAFIEKSGTNTILYDTLDITVAKNPEIDNSIKSFVNGDEIFLEAPYIDNYIYEWTSPSKNKKLGNIARFTDLKPQDFGEYKLIITDKNSQCSSSYTTNVKSEETKEVNVFGSTDDVDIPSNLYREIQKDVPIYECNITGENKANTYLIAYPGYKFTIIGEIDDDYIIRFWKWKENLKKESAKTQEFNKNGFIFRYEVQDKRIKGRILNAETDDPVPGYTVVIKGTTNGTITNYNGEFTLLVEHFPVELTGSLAGYKAESYLINHPSEEKNNFLGSGRLLNDVYYYEKRDGVLNIDKYRYFRIKKTDVDFRSLSFLPVGIRNGWSFSAGTVLIPTKIRNTKDDEGNRHFEFSKDIGLGPFVGAKKRISRYKPNFLTGGISVGVSSVRLTSDNSNSTLTQSVQDVAAFTVAYGLVFEFDNVQIGLFTGKDKINNNETHGSSLGYDWTYQNEWWWSIGFGFEIISRPTKNKINNENSLLNKTN